MKLLIPLLLTAWCVTAQAENLRVTTYTIDATNGLATNTIVVPNGYAVRVSAAQPLYLASTLAPQAWMVKNGIRFDVHKGEVVQGPATFHLTTRDRYSEPTPTSALLTLERWLVLREK